MDLLQFFYKSKGDYKNNGGFHGDVGPFKLAFQNYAGITYCEDTSKKCDNGMCTPVIICTPYAMASLTWD